VNPIIRETIGAGFIISGLHLFFGQFGDKDTHAYQVDHAIIEVQIYLLPLLSCFDEQVSLAIY